MCKATIIKRTIANIEADIVELYKEFHIIPIDKIGERAKKRKAINIAEEIIEELKQRIEP